MTATGIGGRLFDRWRPRGPFVLFSALALVVFLWGLTVRGRVVPLDEDASITAAH